MLLATAISKTRLDKLVAAAAAGVWLSDDGHNFLMEEQFYLDIIMMLMVFVLELLWKKL